LSGNTNYFYKVSAVNSNGESAQSAYASVLTWPSAPTEASAVASSPGSVTVSWVTASGVTAKVYRGNSLSGPYVQIGVSTTGNYIDTGLSSNTTYYYKVSAENSSGESDQSAAVFATTVPTDVPAGLSASTISSSSLSVTWSTVSGMQGYNIYRSTDISGQYTLIGTPTSPSYTDIGLSANTTYYYKVSVFNSAGVAGPQSDPVSARTKPATPIMNRTDGMRDMNGGYTISVYWNRVEGAQSYQIYRSTSASGPYTLVGSQSQPSPGNLVNYAQSSLSSGITYYYKVSAITDGLESDLSNFLSAKTY
jgi:fibronectin type 3 domain-containing protein